MQRHQKHRQLVNISMLTSHHLVLVFPVHCSSRSDRTLRNYFLLLFLLTGHCFTGLTVTTHFAVALNWSLASVTVSMNKRSAF